MIVNMKWTRMAVASLGLAGVAACADEPTGLMEVRVPGALVVSGWIGNVPLNAGLGGDVIWATPPQTFDIVPAEVIVAPDTVEAGRAFTVTTYSVGPSGCWRSDGQTVASYARVVVLKPYDSHSGSEVCTELLLFLAHSSSVVLPDTGEWTLRVEGRRLRLRDDVWDEPISAEKTIVVR
jgi:hypothetical protein